MERRRFKGLAWKINRAKRVGTMHVTRSDLCVDTMRMNLGRGMYLVTECSLRSMKDRKGTK